MSNDTKFWIARLAASGCIAAAFGILIKAVSALAAGDSRSTTLWFVLFFGFACVGMAAAVTYYHYKAERWGSSFNQDEANKIALETLAELGKQHSKKP